MSIHIDAEKRIFTLHTLHSTYQMQADRLDQLLHLYYGARTGGSMDYLLCFADRVFSGNPAGAGEDRTYSLDVLPQEFPYLGSGDFRAAALVVRGGDGACEQKNRGHQDREHMSGQWHRQNSSKPRGQCFAVRRLTGKGRSSIYYHHCTNLYSRTPKT